MRKQESPAGGKVSADGEASKPRHYLSSNVADLLCTLELTRIKLEVEHQISVSEKKFFVSIQNLKKHYLKQVAAKCWRG